jgi:hypothetical protein
MKLDKFKEAEKLRLEIGRLNHKLDEFQKFKDYFDGDVSPNSKDLRYSRFGNGTTIKLNDPKFGDLQEVVDIRFDAFINEMIDELTALINEKEREFKDL